MLLVPGVSLMLKKSGFNEHMLTWPHNLASSPLLTSPAPRKPLAHCLSNRRIIRVVIEECQVKLPRNLSLTTTLRCVSYAAWHGGSWGIIFAWFQEKLVGLVAIKINWLCFVKQKKWKLFFNSPTLLLASPTAPLEWGWIYNLSTTFIPQDSKAGIIDLT